MTTDTKDDDDDDDGDDDDDDDLQLYSEHTVVAGTVGKQSTDTPAFDALVIIIIVIIIIVIIIIFESSCFVSVICLLGKDSLPLPWESPPHSTICASQKPNGKIQLFFFPKTKN